MKKNKVGAMGVGSLLATILILIGAVFGGMYLFGKQQSFGSDGATGGVSASVSCPDDKDWAGTINVQNGYNKTGTETYDTTMNFYDKDTGSLKAQITDTTSGSVTLECGRSYLGKILSTSGASGDSGVITAVSEGSIVDGAIEFSPKGAGNVVTIYSPQHASPELRVYDNVAVGNMFDDSDGTASDYDSSDGIQYWSTTATNTSLAVGSGGKIDVTYYIRSVQSDTDYNDNGGMLVLIDAPSATWDTSNAVISANKGGTLSNVKGTSALTQDESIAYADYELIMLVPAGQKVTSVDELELRIKLSALGGQDPTGAGNVSVDLSPRGHFASTRELNVLKVGAVDDSSSRTQTHTLWDTTLTIS